MLAQGLRVSSGSLAMLAAMRPGLVLCEQLTDAGVVAVTCRLDRPAPRCKPPGGITLDPDQRLARMHSDKH
jgi:hypothetical protein